MIVLHVVCHPSQVQKRMREFHDKPPTATISEVHARVVFGDTTHLFRVILNLEDAKRSVAGLELHKVIFDQPCFISSKTRNYIKSFLRPQIKASAQL